MAVQSGVLFFDGRPTGEERQRLDAGLQPFAPDGVSSIGQPGIAMAFGASHVWTGDERCPQPVRGESGLVVTWDGRLDNRDDLLLRLRGRLTREIADVEIAIAVFERWGIDGLRSLIGDWSLAIWDSRARVLHLARDYMGVRPLYYHVDRDAVMWSTSLGELAVRAGRVDDLEEMFVAEFMALRFSGDITPYTGVRMVPPGICVSIGQGGQEQRQRFWEFSPGTIRYRDSGQYEEHLRALWTDAVGSRLRTAGVVWAELSGGLDSSSVVCMADALIKGGRVPATGLQPVSHVTLESAEGDERRFIASVEAKIEHRSELVGLEEHEGARGDWDWETPLASKDVDVAVVQRMRADNCRLILSGRAGDVVMGCFPDHSVAVLDDVFCGRWGAAASNIRLWSRACQKPFIEVATNVLRAAARSADASSALALAANHRGGPSLLDQRLQRMTANRPAIPVDVSDARASMRHMAALLLRYTNGALAFAPTPPSDVLCTHPFVHRPLVEFMCAIPADQISGPGVTRSLMRRAFDGLVPDRVLARHSKGYYPPAVMRATRALIRSMPDISSFHIVRNQWVVAARLAAAIQNLREGGAQRGGEVRLALLLERWLSARDRRGPAVMPQRKEVTTNAVLNA